MVPGELAGPLGNGLGRRPTPGQASARSQSGAGAAGVDPWKEATTEALVSSYGAQVRAKGALLVSESGLFDRDDLDRVVSAGADAVLVGEALMRQADATAALETLVGG